MLITVNHTCAFSFGFSFPLFLAVSIALIFLRSSTNFSRDTSRSKKFSIIFFCNKKKYIYIYSGAQKSESTPLLYLWFAYNINFIVFLDIHNFWN